MALEGAVSMSSSLVGRMVRVSWRWAVHLRSGCSGVLSRGRCGISISYSPINFIFISPLPCSSIVQRPDDDDAPTFHVLIFHPYFSHPHDNGIIPAH